MVAAQISPQQIAEAYCVSFQTLHGSTPRIRHMNGDWFQVNGEIVHRTTVEAEIDNLKMLAKQTTRRVESGLVNRLIARLRSL